MRLKPTGDATRSRLLEAAGEVFAERGYRAATVREIVRRARANVAAVNYHFGGKQGLYEAVLEHSGAVSREKYPPDLGVRPGDPPEARLRAFVRNFLRSLLDSGRPAWHGQLIVRELADPTPALDRVVQRYMRPLFNLLLSILSEVCRGRAGADRLRFLGRAVIALCVFYKTSGPILARLKSPPPRRLEEIDRLAEAVATFALRGIGDGR